MDITYCLYTLLSRAFPILACAVPLCRREDHTHKWASTLGQRLHQHTNHTGVSRALFVTIHPHEYGSILVLSQTRVTYHHVTYRGRTIPLIGRPPRAGQPHRSEPHLCLSRCTRTFMGRSLYFHRLTRVSYHHVTGVVHSHCFLFFLLTIYSCPIPT